MVFVFYVVNLCTPFPSLPPPLFLSSSCCCSVCWTSRWRHVKSVKNFVCPPQHTKIIHLGSVYSDGTCLRATTTIRKTKTIRKNNNNNSNNNKRNSIKCDIENCTRNADKNEREQQQKCFSSFSFSLMFMSFAQTFIHLNIFATFEYCFNCFPPSLFRACSQIAPIIWMTPRAMPYSGSRPLRTCPNCAMAMQLQQQQVQQQQQQQASHPVAAATALPYSKAAAAPPPPYSTRIRLPPIIVRRQRGEVRHSKGKAM